jgi:4-carboxymuconolactone decarboxylase
MQPHIELRRLSPEQINAVAPVFEDFTQNTLYGDVWDRPGFSKRDRALVTLACLITKGQYPALNYYVSYALDCGVTAKEISEAITHLGFYAGWGNAMGAIGPTREVFAARSIAEVPPAKVDLLPIDEAAEARRAGSIESRFGTVAPGVVQHTTDVLFKNLWLRPDLAPRDRSMITVAALVTAGHSAQIPYHLNRAMDNGLSQTEASEALLQLAYYSGWPSIFSALPTITDVFAGRDKA